MVDFVNKLEFGDQNVQTNGNVIYENHKGEFLFPMKEFVSFGTDRQSMYFIPAGLLKDKINSVCVPQF